MTNQVTEVLEETKRVLLADGWCQGLFHSEERHCLLGAIGTAARNLGVSVNERGAVGDVLSEVLLKENRPTKWGVVGFNDAETTTFNDVMSLIDKALLFSKEKELG